VLRDEGLGIGFRVDGLGFRVDELGFNVEEYGKHVCGCSKGTPSLWVGKPKKIPSPMLGIHKAKHNASALQCAHVIRRSHYVFLYIFPFPQKFVLFVMFEIMQACYNATTL